MPDEPPDDEILDNKKEEPSPFEKFEELAKSVIPVEEQKKQAEQ